MSILIPCQIRGCATYAKIDRDLQPDEFLVCNSCENAIFLTVLSKMEKTGRLPEGTTKNMALVLNAWRRETRGVTGAVRPASAG